MDLDLNLPSLKREAAVRFLKQQPAEIQKMTLENLSFMEQVRAAAELALKHDNWTALLLVDDINAVRLYTKFTTSDAISDFAFAPYDALCTCCLLSKFATPTVPVYRLGCGGKICKDCLGPELERRYIPLEQLRRFLANNKFSQNGMVDAWKNLSYSNLTATGERTEKHTLILGEHASVVTRERFGRNLDDVMYLLDNGEVFRNVQK